MGMMQHAYKHLVEIPEGKRPLGRVRHRWKGNIRMVLGKTGWNGLDSSG
jgi:hypothetical protein